MKDSVENEELVLDTSGTECPIPVLKARKLASELNKDTIIKIIATDPLAEADFEHYCDQSNYEYLSCKKIKDKIVILDGISDPGNLGTILRTANWFGINDVVLSEECVDQYNTKVIRSAMGSHFSMNIVKTDILKYIKNLKSKDFQIVAAALDTKKSIGSLKIVSNKWALLLGSEAHGLSEKVSDLIDSKIRIPQFGIIDSLNVSVACGIFLYHMIDLNK